MYEFEYDEDKLDAFNEASMTSQEDILSDLRWKIMCAENGRDNDEIKFHSVIFRERYIDLLKRFRDEVEKRKLFDELEPWWSYCYTIDEMGITLYLQYVDSVDFDDDKNISCVMVGEKYELICIKAKLLTVEEYAQLYEVTVGTVRQWIRRGKIRCAIKMGNEWRISELSEVTGRGYRHASYETEYPLDSVPNEYAFLKGVKGVFIDQNQKEKNLYRVISVKPNGEREEIMLETQEREKLELFLISSPFFKANTETFANYA